jgi:hypothetical protein
MWKNILWRGRPQLTIWCMRIACWIAKATHAHTHTHSGCATLIAFALQQWLHKRAATLRYTYTACVLEKLPAFNPLNPN